LVCRRSSSPASDGDAARESRWLWQGLQLCVSYVARACVVCSFVVSGPQGSRANLNQNLK
jgi:hypothetical protein